MAQTKLQKPPRISVAIRAWNEEKVIRRTLQSVFEQSIFEELSKRNEICEIICIPNGCTDKTAEIAATVFAEQKRWHPFSHTFKCHIAEMKEAGRNNTWNAYVHSFSSRHAEFLFIMDSDILFNRAETLFNMYSALLENPQAYVASDAQIKDIALKPRKSLLEKISLATSNMTKTIEGQITGQLYCIRSEIARNVWLPKDLGAPDDGFIKAIICTDFFTHEVTPKRIVVAKNASHVYEAYTSPREILDNQKRQMIGQTTVHVLIEHLKKLPLDQRINLADTLRKEEAKNPDWVKWLTHEHLNHHKHFWQLFPNLLSFRFRRWWKMKGIKRLTHLPATLAGLTVTLIACARASQHFRRGEMHYWPKASRETIGNLELGTAMKT
jgi:glycosyltransferase involved in cell wall biosynthesis